MFNKDYMKKGKAPLNFKAPDIRTFIPDGSSLDKAVARVSHLGIVAHQDDLEFNALHGILECWRSEDRWFGGVVCTDGAGCSRSGSYAGLDDERIRAIRLEEQETAAKIGGYGFMVQLGLPSSQARNPGDDVLENDLRMLLAEAQPEIVYTHNLVDKHETHVAVAIRVLKAIRGLPVPQRPRLLLGIEAWRGLDWLPDEDKVHLDVSAHPNLSMALAGVFDSQIAGGKRYDLAMDGRRAANATMFDPYTPDSKSRVTYAMDMTPLIVDDTLDPIQFALGFVHRLENDIRVKLGKWG